MAFSYDRKNVFRKKVRENDTLTPYFYARYLHSPHIVNETECRMNDNK